MSALARYFNHSGLYVAGYDSTPTPLTEALQAEGMDIHYVDDVQAIPQTIIQHQNATLVIYTPAIPAEHKQLNHLQQKGFTIIKRAQALGLISNNYETAAVAGTHGKTSTSTLLAHILHHTEKGCNAFIGGISKNFNSNLLVSNSQRMVVEADEYDRSFHLLNPQLAIITSLDADHLDVYNTKEKLREAFKGFITKINSNGTLIVKKGLESIAQDASDINVITYSANQKADFYAQEITIANGVAHFGLNTPNGKIVNLELGVPGKFNVENAVAAATAAMVWGTSEDIVRRSLQSFMGVERRFDLRYSNGQTFYIDDYAHHPEELKAAISAAREVYPNKKITGIFQPHLYSRTKNFLPEFAQSLSLLDELLLLDIYPAREKPIPGITSLRILEKIDSSNKQLVTLSNTVDTLKKMELEVVLTMGAGNISTLVKPIEQMLKKRSKKHEG